MTEACWTRYLRMMSLVPVLGAVISDHMLSSPRIESALLGVVWSMCWLPAEYHHMWCRSRR